MRADLLLQTLGSLRWGSTQGKPAKNHYDGGALQRGNLHNLKGGDIEVSKKLKRPGKFHITDRI